MRVYRLQPRCIQDHFPSKAARPLSITRRGDSDFSRSYQCLDVPAVLEWGISGRPFRSRLLSFKKRLGPSLDHCLFLPSTNFRRWGHDTLLYVRLLRVTLLTSAVFVYRPLLRVSKWRKATWRTNFWSATESLKLKYKPGCTSISSLLSQNVFLHDWKRQVVPQSRILSSLSASVQ